MTIKEILQKESIRLVDGRWSGGFVDEKRLSKLIESGEAEMFQQQGFTFVRLKKIKVIKMVTHDNQEYFCKTPEERDLFIDNYRRLEGERLQKQFPKKMSLIDRIEIIEMTENEYSSILVDVNAVNYFKGEDD